MTKKRNDDLFVLTPRALITQVHKKLNNRKSFPFKHIKPIVLIFLDELKKDLVHERKPLIIENFGKIFYSLPRPRKFFNLFTREVEESDGNSLLKLQLFRFVRKKLLSLIDLDKTFHNGQDD